jgi:hypothetical protein
MPATSGDAAHPLNTNYAALGVLPVVSPAFAQECANGGCKARNKSRKADEPLQVVTPEERALPLDSKETENSAFCHHCRSRRTLNKLVSCTNQILPSPPVPLPSPCEASSSSSSSSDSASSASPSSSEHSASGNPGKRRKTKSSSRVSVASPPSCSPPSMPPQATGCQRLYCDHCIAKFYVDRAHVLSGGKRSWMCPHCLNQCMCNTCRQNYSVGVADPRTMSPATSMAAGLVHMQDMLHAQMSFLDKKKGQMLPPAQSPKVGPRSSPRS